MRTYIIYIYVCMHFFFFNVKITVKGIFSQLPTYIYSIISRQIITIKRGIDECRLLLFPRP